MSQIGDSIRNLEGYTPRVIAELKDVTWDVEFVRDDVEGRYSDSDLDGAYQLLMATHVSGADFKTLIEEDRFNAQTLFFDTIVVFFFPPERYEGVFASFDYDDGFPVNELVKRVSEARTGDQ